MDEYVTESAYSINGNESDLVEKLLAELSLTLEYLGVHDYHNLDDTDKRNLLDSAVTILSPNELSQDGVKRIVCSRVNWTSSDHKRSWLLL